MRHFATALVATLILATTFAVTARPASAKAPEDGDYRSAMKPFVPVLENYADKLEMAADAAVVKPELACGAEMTELARIAGWMAQDLVGTARLAPDYIAAAHDKLTASVVTFGVHAAASCTDPAAAAGAIDAERPAFDAALRQIELFTKFGGDAV